MQFRGQAAAHQKTGDTLLQAIFIALQLVLPARNRS